ncbi:MAG TPA: endolytic transglycosylase MltG [Candidatus Saccharimonadales bacterium]|nr:endolytic transglycosylase MltG [Candidatus Saccharimonadales bacterium]
MSYQMQTRPRRSWLRRVLISFGIVILLLASATAAVWHYYSQNLQPVSSTGATQTVTIASGSSPSQIANLLHRDGLIRSSWTFERYVQSKGVSQDLQAGTYTLSPTQSVAEIVSQLTHGKVTTQLVTILPGQRLDQIKQSLINQGFSEADVAAALDPAQYAGNAALVDKPAGNNLEGYLYPDSFQRAGTTKVSDIVKESIAEMQTHLTPDIRAAFAREGLNPYQGIILASIIDQEVSKTSDRAQAAQVFLKRLNIGMSLGSDVTAIYGSRLAGQGTSLSYDTPYNTLIHTGLPPTPISNVDESALQAVAHPAATDWLYFVAGDDGTTYFSSTLQQHQAYTQQYCHKLCGQ